MPPQAPKSNAAIAASGLRISETDHVTEIVFDRPPGNRVSLDLLSQLLTVLDRLADSPTARTVVLRANGEDFCQGADLADSDLATEMTTQAGRLGVAQLGQHLVDRWSRLPVPTLCAARGRIIGAGACLFATADFKFATPKATLQLPEIDRAMHLSWGILPRLAQEFGINWARRLGMTGQAVAVESLPDGSLTIGADPESLALALAVTLAQKSPAAMRAIKSVTALLSVSDAAFGDPGLFADTTNSPDFVEAMTAFFEKRPPNFG